MFGSYPEEEAERFFRRGVERGDGVENHTLAEGIEFAHNPLRHIHPLLSTDLTVAASKVVLKAIAASDSFSED